LQSHYENKIIFDGEQSTCTCMPPHANVFCDLDLLWLWTHDL